MTECRLEDVTIASERLCEMRDEIDDMMGESL